MKLACFLIVVSTRYAGAINTEIASHAHVNDKCKITEQANPKLSNKYSAFLQQLALLTHDSAM